MAGMADDSDQAMSTEELRLSAEVDARLQMLGAADNLGLPGAPSSVDSPTSVVMESMEVEAKPSAPEPINLEVLRDMVTEQQAASNALESGLASAAAALGSRMPGPLVLPWEHGFAGLVLGQGVDLFMPNVDPNLKVDLEELYQNVDVEQAPPEPAEKDNKDRFMSALKMQCQRPSIVEEEKQERDKELERWMVVCAAIGTECETCKMIQDEGSAMLVDVLARKKTGTLKVRSTAVLLYIRWAKSKGLPAFPLSVEKAYKYVDELRRNKAPATRANSFRSALAFLKGTFKVAGVDEILDSAAVSGSCHRSFLTKRLLKQRDALTVDQVRTLEAVVTGDNVEADKVFAGHCLMCIYGRLRFGDSQGVESEPTIDGDYLEAGTSMHKTDSMFGRARRMLPVAAPAVGVSRGCWAASFLQARKEAGLRAGPGRPFMPAPINGGGWSRGKLKTSEASTWLCEMLQKYNVVDQDLTNVGAHSMKATSLSWMAKAAMPEKARRMLGYHVKPKDKSLVIYSRDALAGPLEMLNDLVVKIALGEFMPDQSRSGRWKRKQPEEAVEEVAPSSGDEVLDVQSPVETIATVKTPTKEVERFVEHENSTSSSEESDGEESAEGEDERVVEKVVVGLVGPPKNRGQTLYRHGLSGTIHVGSNMEGMLACGSKVTDLMVQLEEAVHGVGAMCKICTGYHR